MSITKNHQNDQDEDTIEIHLLDIINFFSINKGKILLGGILGIILGVLYSFSKPNIYTSQISVMPEIQGKGVANLGSLGSLAGLAGINIDNMGSSDAIRPDLYPNVLQSIPFALYLLKQPVYSVKLNKKLSLEEYVKETDKGWFNFLLSTENKLEDINEKIIPNNPNIIKLTKDQNSLVKSVQSNVTTVYDKKTGVLSITAIEPEAYIAASVVDKSLDYLTNYITTYRTEKARRQVDFLQKQIAEAKRKYQNDEFALSSYRDKNRNLYLNTVKIEEQRLQADYLLSQSVYSELSKQLEQAKITVQQETPVFKILEPPTIPIQKSGPKRTIIIAICALMFILITIAIQLVRALLLRNESI